MKAHISAAIFIASSMGLVGCSAVSQEDRAFAIEICSPVYDVDWTNLDFDDYAELTTEFNSLKNQSSLYGEEVQALSQGLSELVSDLDAAGDKFRSETSALTSTFDLNTTDLDQLKADQDKITEAFWAERDRVSSAINDLCAPHFE